VKFGLIIKDLRRNMSSKSELSVLRTINENVHSIFI
jgi:hypothetical protein